MTLFSRLWKVTRYSVIFRYGNAFHSSPRYLIRTSGVEFKQRKRSIQRTFRGFERSFDRTLKVQTEKNRNYGIEHVNKSRNMSTEHGEVDSSVQKESDDISLPFWIFLWSLLAVFAGYIYTKLNKSKEIDSGLKSNTEQSVNDEKIARKLVNEISRNGADRGGIKHTFRRQRSYEIIDGEVRIHYDVSKFEEDVKRSNIEAILKTAEVESIPIRSASVDDYELIYPGNLPRIVEEGDEEELENPSTEEDNVYVHESGLDTELCTDNVEETFLNTSSEGKQLNSTLKSHANVSEIDERNFETEREDFTFTFEKISNAELIPPADSSVIKLDIEKDSSELRHESESNVNLNENTTSEDKLSAPSKGFAVESLRCPTSTDENSLHNPNTTTTKAVYKLREVEKNKGQSFKVTRKEVTKLQNSEESCVDLQPKQDETSFLFVETKPKDQSTAAYENNKQLNREVKTDTQEKMQIVHTAAHVVENSTKVDFSFNQKQVTESETLNSDVIKANKVENFAENEQDIDFIKADSTTESFQSNLHQVCPRDHSNNNYCDSSDKIDFRQNLLEHKQVAEEKSDSQVQEPCILTCLEEGSDILVDNSGDFLFKVIGRSIEDEYWEDMIETEGGLSDDIKIFALDENENCEKLNDEHDLEKSWKSLPSWEDVLYCRDMDSNSSDAGGSDDDSGLLAEHDNGMKSSTHVEQPVEVKKDNLVESDPVIEKTGIEHMQKHSDRHTHKNSDISPVKSVEVTTEEIKIAPSLNIDNKIRSRKTIFLKSAPVPKNDNSTENIPIETCSDSTGDIVKDYGKVMQFEEDIIESCKLEKLEFEITKKSFMASQGLAIQQDKPLEENSTPLVNENAEEPVARDCEKVMFAEASLIKEDILTAKLVSLEGTEHLKAENGSSGSYKSMDTDLRTLEANSVQETRTSTAKGFETPLESKEPNELNSQDNPVALDGYKVKRQTQTASKLTSCDTKSVKEEFTNSTVHSMIRKLEEARTVETMNRSECIYSNSDTEEHKIKPLNYTVLIKENVKAGSESKDYQIQHEKKEEFSNMCITKDKVDDNKRSERISGSTVVCEGEETGLPVKSEVNSDNTVFKQDLHKTTISADSVDLSTQNGKFTQQIQAGSAKSDAKVEFKSECKTFNVHGVTELLEEIQEDIVICASQVPEEIQAKPVDSIPCNLAEISKQNEQVIYAGQVCESESIAQNNNESDSIKTSYLDNGHSLSRKSNKNDHNTTVIYANQFTESELTPETLIEDNANPLDRKVVSGDDITEDPVPAKQSEQNDITHIHSISSNYEIRSYMETSFDHIPSASRPIKNSSPPKVLGDVPGTSSPEVLGDNPVGSTPEVLRDVLVSSSLEFLGDIPASDPPGVPEDSPVCSPSKGLGATPVNNSLGVLHDVPASNVPEGRSDTFLGETDVNTLSDIDEIDIDVLPDENYQKSKSVTDLDEALASFGSLDYLSDHTSICGERSKSMPDILDSYPEESVKVTQTNPTSEKLKTKKLSLSTPEMNSKPGLKNVTKVKVVHVNFLEMQDNSGSDNVEEDSFIYKRDVPISGKIKRHSRALSPAFMSPVTSPPPGEEIVQERWISEKTNLKQIEFEFGDLFQNSPSPPPLEGCSSIIHDSNQTDLVAGNNDSKFEDSTRVYLTRGSMLPEASGQASTAGIDPKLNIDLLDSPQLDSTEQNLPVLDIDNQHLQTIDASTTDNSQFKIQNCQPVSTQNSSSTATCYKTSTTTSSKLISNDTKLASNKQKPIENVIPATPLSTEFTASSVVHQSPSVIHLSARSLKNDTSSKDVAHSKVVTKVEYQNDNSPPASSNSHTARPQVSTKSYRYTPGNVHSYSKVPKPVPEQGKYVVKYCVVAKTLSTTTKPLHNKNIITTQARYTESPVASSPRSSPLLGMKLSEKFRMSDGDGFEGQKVSSEKADGKNARKSNTRVSKGTSRQGGRLVTVKGGVINDYECSSDADSEMSYKLPSPRVKVKKYYRPPAYRDAIDSASSSEPDSPRQRKMKEDRQSMSEVFGVADEQYASVGIKDGRGSAGSVSSSGENLFSRFGKMEESDETKHSVERLLSSPYLPRASSDQRGRDSSPPYQQRVSTFDHRPNRFDQKQREPRSYNPRQMNALERNLSPTSFLQKGSFISDDVGKMMEFNPFEELQDRDSLQPLERCHSPSSVYSDTSSVFSFNCDFDPMTPPDGESEPEVHTCENPTCGRQDILLGPEKTSFKSCPACFTYYCSSECRKLHWPAHKQSCYFGRVNTYVRSIIRLCQRREDLSMNLSQVARDGYKKKGRGVVMAVFNSPEMAREFITKGHEAFSGRKPTYSSLAELSREGIISKHRVALMQAVRDYEPNEEFVFNIAVVATNNIPMAPAPRYKLNTVLHCIKMPLNEMIVARQPKDYEKVETRLFALPKCSRHEFVNKMEARRHYCRNLSKNLRQYNIKLKDDFPECYRSLCMYVEHNIPFEPMTVYGQRSGLSYKCIIAPEQSYPLAAEYC